jgi:MinD-like ATPase involved in chromosome partitioning or flagellar assembly
MGTVIAFVPASGGLGSSTLAAAVAVRAAAASRSSVLVDLDPLGGPKDVLFGIEESPGWRWPDLSEVAGIVDGHGLADELPMACGVAVLTSVGARAAPGEGPWQVDSFGEWVDTVPDVVAGLADAHDITVLDLPRDARVLSAVALLVDAVVVVAGAPVPQLAAAAATVPGVRRLLAGLRDTGRPWREAPLLPIEPWVVMRGNRVEADLQDVVMDQLDVPLVATIPDDRRLVADVSEGLPPGARGRGAVVHAADALLLRLVEQAVAA